jgi:urease accessory protein
MTLAPLLQLCDSLFPTGAFSHADGLEAATAAGEVAGADGLRDWMRAMLDGPLRADAVAVRQAIQLARGQGCAFGVEDARDRAEEDARDPAGEDARELADQDVREPAGTPRWGALSALDDELLALRPSRAGREALRAVGTRLLKTWVQLRPSPAAVEFLARRGDRGVTLPVAFGLACEAIGLEPSAAIEAFLYTRLAGTASAAMRLTSIGQTAAHRALAGAIASIPAIAAWAVATDTAPGSFAPALDMAVMSHQYVESRLFRS